MNKKQERSFSLLKLLNGDIRNILFPLRTSLSSSTDFFGTTRMIYGGQVIHHMEEKENSKLCKVSSPTRSRILP